MARHLVWFSFSGELKLYRETRLIIARFPWAKHPKLEIPAERLVLCCPEISQPRIRQKRYKLQQEACPLVQVGSTAAPIRVQVEDRLQPPFVTLTIIFSISYKPTALEADLL